MDFNVVDSFDTHARIPEHFADVDAGGIRRADMWASFPCGWDPGMFSLNRLYANCNSSGGKDYTFWGKGVSQGHSDAIRRIAGRKGRQTVHHSGTEKQLEAVRSGENPELTTRQKHTRECFVVAEEGADLAEDRRRDQDHAELFRTIMIQPYTSSAEEEMKQRSQRTSSRRLCHSYRRDRNGQRA